jgi:hypothetical protein
MSQFRSVIPADGPSTYNSVSHISFTIPKKLLQKYEKKLKPTNFANDLRCFCENAVARTAVIPLDFPWRGKERSRFTGAKRRFTGKSRIVSGERPTFSFSQRAGKLLAAAAANIGSGRGNCRQRALRTKFYSVGVVCRMA